MIRIKKINEDWSEDYTYDFTDNGFEIEEEGLILKGKYKGQFVMTQLNDWFVEMTDKMSDEHEIARVKTYFNQVTGNASFEVEIKPNRKFSIEVKVGNEIVEYFPSIIYSNIYDSRVNINKVTGSIGFDGSLKNGQKKELVIYQRHLRDRSRNEIEEIDLKFNFGSRGRGISITKEELSKLFDNIFSNELKFMTYKDNSRNLLLFSELTKEEQERIHKFKNQIIS